MPAVVVSGARQTGKSTLAQDLTPAPADSSRSTTSTRWSWPDGTPRRWSRDRPSRWTRCSGSPTCSGRRAGRFLLTGSANLLLMRGVSESLAGRASYLTLWPMHLPGFCCRS